MDLNTRPAYTVLVGRPQAPPEAYHRVLYDDPSKPNVRYGILDRRTKGQRARDRMVPAPVESKRR